MASKNEGGWIEHDGGKCPVEPATRVRVQYLNEPRENAERYTPKAASFRNWPWKKAGRAISTRDIIAYQVVEG
jgi:hypothetical protein